MIVITYFDRVFGPKIFLTSPNNLLEELYEEHERLIKSLLENDINGFFFHYFTPDFKTANYILSLDSRYARGLKEIVMISAILSEHEPNYQVYEKILTKFANKLQSIPEIYKAFYINSELATEDVGIQTNYDVLNEELNIIYKIISIKKIVTEGHIITFEKLKKQKEVKLSDDIIDKLSELTSKKKHCFLVFRIQNKVLKLDIIPVESEKVIKLEIIFSEQMTIKVLQQVTQILSKYKTGVSLIFTSGVCQEIDKCVYEAYIDTDNTTLEKLKEDINQISGVLSVESQNIKI